MPDRPYIYVDMLFLINFLMDYVIIWAAARLAQISAFRWRLAAAACLGALYSVIVLLPGWSNLSSVAIKFLISLLMLAVAFIPLSLKKFSRTLIYFYLISFTMGGAVIGVQYFMSSVSNSPVLGVPLPYLWLVVAFVVAVLVGKWGVPLMRKAFMQDLQRVPVQIRIRGQILRVNALVDTGNQLLDPLTGAPVIIVEYAAMASLLPIQVREVMGIGGEVNLDKMAEFTDGQFSLRLIPFTTIGKNHGMLVGFKPDEVAIQHGDQMVRRTNVVIGIYSRKLSPKGAYRALLHPDLLNASGGIN